VSLSKVCVLKDVIFKCYPRVWCTLSLLNAKLLSETRGIHFLCTLWTTISTLRIVLPVNTVHSSKTILKLSNKKLLFLNPHIKTYPTPWGSAKNIIGNFYALNDRFELKGCFHNQYALFCNANAIFAKNPVKFVHKIPLRMRYNSSRNGSTKISIVISWRTCRSNAFRIHKGRIYIRQRSCFHDS
jgi:hypothetical protein